MDHNDDDDHEGMASSEQNEPLESQPLLPQPNGDNHQSRTLQHIIERIQVRFDRINSFRWQIQSSQRHSHDHHGPSRKPVSWKPLFIIIITYALTFFVWWIGFRSLGFGSRVIPASEVELHNQEQPVPIVSGLDAWGIVQNITRTSHPYNSFENTRVRHVLVDVLENIQQDIFKHGECHPQTRLEILKDDNVNISLPYGKNRYLFFESENVVARLFGSGSSSNESFALLVSTHYDSVPSSYGVTDDGLSVGSAMAVFKALSFHICRFGPLKYDVIFLWNNGEEIDMLGGAAFTRHPWFQDIVGFINLEGSGVAMGERSTLVRTNSAPLLQSFINVAPFPHISVTVNHVVKAIPSDTDYRPYVELAPGNLPGLDFAWITFWSLYHTHRDDMSHVSGVTGVQQLSENLLSVVMELCGEAKGLQKVAQEYLEDKRLGDSSYDPVTRALPVPDFIYFDLMGWKAFLFSKWQMMIVHIILLICFVGVIGAHYMIATAESQTMPLWNMTKNTLWDMMTPWLAFLLTIVFCGCISWIKSLINPGSTFGLVEQNLIMLVVLTFVCIYLSTYLMYSKTEVETNPSVFSSGHLLAFGVCLFWVFGVVFSFMLVFSGLDIIYFVVYPAGFSCLSYLLCFMLFQIRFSNEQARPSWSVSSLTEPTVFLFLAACPSLYMTIDLYRELVITLPSLVAQGALEPGIDVLFSVLAFLILLPALPLARRISDKAVLLLSLLALVLFVWSSLVFPFQPDRPVSVTFTQVWDITSNETWNMSVGSLVVAQVMRPSVFVQKVGLESVVSNLSCSSRSCSFQLHHRPIVSLSPLLSESPTPMDLEAFNHPELLIQAFNLSMKRIHVGQDMHLSLSGTILASTFSRSCFLDVNALNQTMNDVVHMNVSLAESEHGLIHRIYENATHSAYGPTPFSATIHVLRRINALSPDSSRMRIPFHMNLTLDGHDFPMHRLMSDVELSVMCAYHSHTTRDLIALNEKLPDWSARNSLWDDEDDRIGINDDRVLHGSFFIRKKFFFVE